MNYKMVGRFMSLVIITEAVFMVPAWIISLIHGRGDFHYGICNNDHRIDPCRTAYVYALS